MTKRVLLLAGSVLLLGAWAGSASAQQNNYTCYKVKDLKTPAKFVGQTVTSVDQTEAQILDLKKAYLLCDPASINGGPFADVTLHYVCYKAKGNKVSVNYDTTDMFGPLRLQTKKPFLLSTPATKAPA